MENRTELKHVWNIQKTEGGKYWKPTPFFNLVNLRVKPTETLKAAVWLIPRKAVLFPSFSSWNQNLLLIWKVETGSPVCEKQVISLASYISYQGARISNKASAFGFPFSSCSGSPSMHADSFWVTLEKKLLKLAPSCRLHYTSWAPELYMWRVVRQSFHQLSSVFSNFPERVRLRVTKEKKNKKNSCLDLLRHYFISACLAHVPTCSVSQSVFSCVTSKPLWNKNSGVSWEVLWSD